MSNLEPYIGDSSTEIVPDVLPFHAYKNLAALQNNYVGDLHNSVDEVDAELFESFSTTCAYYDSVAFQNLCLKNCFSLVVHNINSIAKNLESFQSEILGNDHRPMIIGFCETKLNKDIENLYNLDGYESVFNSNCTRSGGLALFVRSSISFSIRNEFFFSDSFLECLCVEIDLGYEKNTICLMYRRPGSDFDCFIAKYNEIIGSLGGRRVYVCGDLNLNLLQYETSSIVQTFVNLNYEHSFHSLINKPTRVSSHSATVIDHIWCNFSSIQPPTCGIVLSGISDHFVPFCCQAPTAPRLDDEPGNLRSYRCWDKLSDPCFAEVLTSELNKYNFDNSESSIDTLFSFLISAINNTINSLCPIKYFDPSKKRGVFNPWMTSELKQLIRQKNRLYSKFCRRPITFGAEYRSIRNRVNVLRESTKRNYYQSLLIKNQYSSKKTWEVLNGIAGRNARTNSKFSQLNVDGSILTSAADIANAFNKHFGEAPVIIADSLPPCDSLNFKEYLTGHYPNLTTRVMTATDVHDILKSLKRTGSGGFIDIPYIVISAAIEQIVAPLTSIFNRCLSEGYFPNILKISSVVPVFKKGSTDVANDFRPISILSTFSKIFEKFLHIEFSNHLNSHNAITASQFGFKHGVSTDIAIAKLLENVYKGLNQNLYGIGVFLDLQKAFDLVKHEILLEKLHHYGIRGSLLSLVRSFLFNRKQYVIINNSKSDILPIRIGTPQGSILSPLLFLIFINDIVNSSNILKFNLFADDTCIYLNHSNIQDLFSTFNIELGKISLWIKANKLSLNVKKSAYLLFSGRKLLPNELPVLRIFDEPIVRLTETKFLGLIIDHQVNWKSHAAYVHSKVSRMIGVLYKIRKMLTKSALKTIYYSLIYPHYRYGIIFWGSVNRCDFSKLFRAQKKVIRYIEGANRFAHSEPLFKTNKILKLEEIKTIEICKFIFNDLNFGHRFDFSARNVTFEHNTRYNSHLSLPQPRINSFKNSIFYDGIKLFNTLPQYLKQYDNKASFKIYLKIMLLSTYDPG